MKIKRIEFLVKSLDDVLCLVLISQQLITIRQRDWRIRNGFVTPMPQCIYILFEYDFCTEPSSLIAHLTPHLSSIFLHIILQFMLSYYMML